MGWFKKENKKEEGFPRLPELPKLPDLPSIGDDGFRSIHQLPSFPTNSFGEKFSQNTIKDAVSGKKEVELTPDADDFDEEFEGEMMQKEPIRKPYSIEQEDFGKIARARNTKPIFVRMDKFEESLKIFEEIKRQILEIEKSLEEAKKIKEREEKELSLWEKEVKTMKMQMEKIDENIFSKIE